MNEKFPLFTGNYLTALFFTNRNAARQAQRLIHGIFPDQQAFAQKLNKKTWAIQVSAINWLSAPDLVELTKRRDNMAAIGRGSKWA